MGAEVLIPLALSAASAGAGVYNTRQTAKRQDQAAALGIQQQARKQREADARVSAEVGALEQSSPENSRKQATDAFLSQLRRTRGQAVAGGPAGASDRYTADLAAVEGDVRDFGANAAGTMARINAPTLQRAEEGRRTGRLSTDLSTISNAAGGDDFLSQLRLRAIGRNPWIDAAGQLAGGVASGMASQGTGKFGVNDPRAIRRVTGFGTPPYAGAPA